MTGAGTDTIMGRLVALAAARRVLADHTAELLEAKTAFQAEHAGLLAAMDEGKAQIEAESAAVRAMGLTLYLADPSNKAPAPGVTIKVMTGVEYDAKHALAWAKDKGIALSVSLDEKAFKVIAPTLDEETKERIGVKETATPTVQIATDLDKALAAVTA
jgi:hypothetical protein